MKNEITEGFSKYKYYNPEFAVHLDYDKEGNSLLVDSQGNIISGLSEIEPLEENFPQEQLQPEYTDNTVLINPIKEYKDGDTYIDEKGRTILVKKFGNLEIGDKILSADGSTVNVTEAYDEHIPEDSYKIEMDNGSIIKASGNHLWYIITENDKYYHNNRLKKSKKILKKYMDANVESPLADLALEDDTGDVIETSLLDILSMLTKEDKSYHKILSNEHYGLRAVIERIAKSIGHVSENKVKLEDNYSNISIPEYEVKYYDARVFAQQILLLYRPRIYKKLEWEVKKGRVVTTRELINLTDDYEIPDSSVKKKKP